MVSVSSRCAERERATLKGLSNEPPSGVASLPCRLNTCAIRGCSLYPIRMSRFKTQYARHKFFSRRLAVTLLWHCFPSVATPCCYGVVFPPSRCTLSIESTVHKAIHPEFRRTRGNINSMKEHAELLSSVRVDISEYKTVGSGRDRSRAFGHTPIESYSTEISHVGRREPWLGDVAFHPDALVPELLLASGCVSPGLVPAPLRARLRTVPTVRIRPPSPAQVNRRSSLPLSVRLISPPFSLCLPLPPTLPLSPVLLPSLSVSFPLSHSLPPSLSLALSRSLSPSFSLSLAPSHPPSLSLSPSVFVLSLPPPPTHPPSLCLSFPHLHMLAAFHPAAAKSSLLPFEDPPETLPPSEILAPSNRTLTAAEKTCEELIDEL
ncbi:hypothetical protein ACLOJK_015695 [Asimina triloba]